MILMTTNAGGSFVNPDTEAANGDYKLRATTNWQISFLTTGNLPITGKFTYTILFKI
jgi:hypothetical protein